MSFNLINFLTKIFFY